MDTIQVSTPTGSYPVYVGRGALAELGRLVRELGMGAQAALITSDPVGDLYEGTAVASLRRAGLNPALCRVPDGERFKTLGTVSAIYDQLIDHQLDRKSVLIALGGGVIGDMGGFAAATYLRGIPLVQVPTTLLAMVDSSLGGKVAVDHPRGKNLIGAFYQPRLVLTDTATLSTLPPVEWRAGLAEVIKHGMISAPDLFAHLEQQGTEPLDWVVQRAIAVKVEVIQEDPYEMGRRAVLNLGHTFAHAFETICDFKLRHGEAVGIGLVAATRTAIRMGLCPAGVESRVVNLLQRFDIPTRFGGHAPEAIRACMATDKKRRGSRLRFVLPLEIGQVVVRDDVPEEMILEVLASLASR